MVCTRKTGNSFCRNFILSFLTIVGQKKTHGLRYTCTCMRRLPFYDFNPLILRRRFFGPERILYFNRPGLGGFSKTPCTVRSRGCSFVVHARHIILCTRLVFVIETSFCIPTTIRGRRTRFQWQSRRLDVIREYYTNRAEAFGVRNSDFTKRRYNTTTTRLIYVSVSCINDALKYTL